MEVSVQRRYGGLARNTSVAVETFGPVSSERPHVRNLGECGQKRSGPLLVLLDDLLVGGTAGNRDRVLSASMAFLAVTLPARPNG